MSGFEFGVGINDAFKIADAVYKVATALRSGPTGPGSRMTALRADSEQMDVAQQQCIDLARRIGDEMARFSEDLRQVTSKVSSMEFDWGLLQELDDYRKTKDECQQFFKRFWTFSESRRRLSFAKGWDAISWVHHGEDEFRGLRDDLNRHRSRLMLILGQLNTSILATHTSMMVENRSMMMENNSMMRKVCESICPGQYAPSVRENAYGCAREYSSTSAIASGAYEYPREDLGYHSAESSRRPSTAGPSIAAQPRAIPGYDLNYSWGDIPADKCIDSGYQSSGKKPSISSRSTSFSLQPVREKLKEESSPGELLEHSFWQPSHASHGIRHGSTSTHGHSSSRRSAHETKIRASMSSKSSRQEAKLEAATFESLTQYQTFDGTPHTFHDVNISCLGDRWESCTIAVYDGAEQCSILASASAADTSGRQIPSMAWTKKDVPYPHLEPLRKRSKRDAMRYPVIPIRGGKPIGFTYSFAQEDDAASFRSLIYGYCAIDNFEIFKIYRDTSEDMKGSTVTLWQSYTDGSYHIAYLPLGSRASSRFAVRIFGRNIEKVSDKGSVLKVHVRYKGNPKSTCMEFAAAKGCKTGNDPELYRLWVTLDDKVINNVGQ